jgi:hypothetical protein
MSTEPNVSHEWDFNVNLSDVQAPTMLPGENNVPEGFYKARVKDMYINMDNNPDRVIIKHELTGDFAGAIRTDGMNRPKDAKDNVRYYWRALAESAGYTAAQLDAGEVTFGPKTFIGKTVHFYYKPGDRKQGTYDRITYFAESVWTQKKADFKPSEETASAPAGSALGGTNNGSETTTPKDVLGALGVSLS